MDVRIEEEEIIERERLAEEGGGKVRCKRTMARLRHSQNPSTHFNTPQARMINDTVQYRLQESKTSHLPAPVSLHSGGE